MTSISTIFANNNLYVVVFMWDFWYRSVTQLLKLNTLIFNLILERGIISSQIGMAKKSIKVGLHGDYLSRGQVQGLIWFPQGWGWSPHLLNTVGTENEVLVPWRPTKFPFMYHIYIWSSYINVTLSNCYTIELLFVAVIFYKTNR